MLGIAAVAAWLGDSIELGLWFAGGLLVSLLAMAGVSWLLLRGLKALPKLLPRKLPARCATALPNLYRPGMHAEAILVALGIGVTFTLSVYLIQSSVLTQMVKSAPPEMPNVFFINVTDAERGGLLEIVRRQPGVAGTGRAGSLGRGPAGNRRWRSGRGSQNRPRRTTVSARPAPSPG